MTAGSPLHQPLRHESGLRHTTGEALYIDDLPTPRGLLHGYAVVSNIPHGRLESVDTSEARRMPGVEAVLTAVDAPGINQIGPVAHDEPLFAEGEVFSHGQVIAVVYAESREQARRAAQAVRVDLTPLPALIDIQDAIAAGSFHTAPHVMQRGDVESALASAPVRLDGEVSCGGQDHFYLETHVALATPLEGGHLHILSSTQHPTEVQAKVAEVLDWGRHRIVVEVPRMGGGFGGKETQGAHWAALAALGAVVTGRPVKVWLDRDQDMVQTGKRHPFLIRYRAGFHTDGRLAGLEARVFANGGWTLDLSRSICDRALFHLGNGYWIPALRFEGRVVKTHVASNTAFRGFGGPQGMLAIEMILQRAAEVLQLDPAEVRARNYLGESPRNETPYHQPVPDCRLPRMQAQLLAEADYERRKAEVAAFNASNPWRKRGLGVAPVQFGISFTFSTLNQAGALVLVYADGSVQVNHGGTEMGQGLHTKMLAVAADTLGAPLASIRLMNTATDKVPNTSATAASSGADLNGQAVFRACETIRERMRSVALSQWKLPESEAPAITFVAGEVSHPPSGHRMTFAHLAHLCWAAQVSLSSTGFYRTPGLHYDPSKGRGHPFFYYAYGFALVEAELCGLTGEHRLLRVDILHDAGNSLSPAIDIGQVEGAFVQGAGWLTCEELVWDSAGRLRTHSPDTYKIPAVGDAPLNFRVRLLEKADQPGTIAGSKAVGEPPLMLGIGAVTALRQCVAAFGRPGYEVNLGIPCTPEALLRAVVDQQERSAATIGG